VKRDINPKVLRGSMVNAKKLVWINEMILILVGNFDLELGNFVL